MVEDNIYGGQITAREWSELIGFGPILLGLEIMGWLPEMMAPARENHLVRSSAIVNRMVYDKGRIEYTTFDAPVNTVDVLRLAFAPRSVIADGKALQSRSNLAANGYSVRKLTGGDCIVSIRRDGAKSVVLTGNDPQQVIDDGRLQYQGAWQVSSNQKDNGGGVHLSDKKNAAVTCRFEGNQVRLIGRADSSGGLADIYLDNTKQMVGIDCWLPSAARHQQVLYSRSGLSNGPHELKIVVCGEKNSYANGANIYVDGVQFSAASASSDFGSGGGPIGPQRMIFGFTNRTPYADSLKQEWFPGTEFVVRTGDMTDSVATTWWTQPVKESIPGTPDPELYRYGVHAPEFWVNLTVGPGQYDVRLKFAERRDPADPKRRPMKVAINGRPVAQALDVAQKAGGYAKPLDLTFERIRPEHGIVEIRFTGTEGGEAMIQAIEVTPAQGRN
jgi:Malectin domain